MPAIKPIKQKELIRFLRKLDFIGPYSGGKHQFMVKGNFHAGRLSQQRGILNFKPLLFKRRHLPKSQDVDVMCWEECGMDFRVNYLWFMLNRIGDEEE